MNQYETSLDASRNQHFELNSGFIETPASDYLISVEVSLVNTTAFSVIFGQALGGASSSMFVNANNQIIVDDDVEDGIRTGQGIFNRNAATATIVLTNPASGDITLNYNGQSYQFSPGSIGVFRINTLGNRATNANPWNGVIKNFRVEYPIGTVRYSSALNENFSPANPNAANTGSESTFFIAQNIEAGDPTLIPDTVAPVISNVSATNITQTESTIAWDTDEPATGQLTFTLTTGLGTSHQIDLSRLNAGQTYDYTIVATDSSGNASAPLQASFTTDAPPLISNVLETNITPTGATISWDTNEPATGQLTVTGVGIFNTALGTSHQVIVSGLSAGQIYDYTIIATDTNSNPSTPFSDSFTSEIPPEITNVVELNITPTSATITWDTSEPATGQLTVPSIGIYTTDLGTSHQVDINGLSAAQVYSYTIIATDGNNIPSEPVNGSFTAEAPPIITSFSAISNAPTSATITWDTNEPATGELMVLGVGTFTTGLSTSHLVDVSGLSAGQTYNYSIIATDAVNNASPPLESSFTTESPPEISNVLESNLTFTSVTITWNTNEPATGQLNVVGLGTFPTSLGVSHQVDISGLSSGQTYDFTIIATDANGNPSSPFEGTFTAEAPPQISNDLVSNVTPTSATITWDTNEPATGQLTIPGVDTFITGLGTSHLVNVSGLSAGQTYNYTIIATDANGNPSSPFEGTFTAEAPPAISNVLESNITPTSATITWDTNEPATGQLTIPGVDTFITGLGTSHLVNVTGLSAGQTYNYTIIATDGNGNSSAPTDNSFTTSGGGTGPELPVISNILGSAITDVNATISWNTDIPTTGTLTVAGIDTYTTTLGTTHSVIVTGLRPAQSYNATLVATDENSNASDSWNVEIVSAEYETSLNASNNQHWEVNSGGSITTPESGWRVEIEAELINTQDFSVLIGRSNNSISSLFVNTNDLLILKDNTNQDIRSNADVFMRTPGYKAITIDNPGGTDTGTLSLDGSQVAINNMGVLSFNTIGNRVANANPWNGRVRRLRVEYPIGTTRYDFALNENFGTTNPNAFNAGSEAGFLIAQNISDGDSTLVTAGSVTATNGGGGIVNPPLPPSNIYAIYRADIASDDKNDLGNESNDEVTITLNNGLQFVVFTTDYFGQFANSPIASTNFSNVNWVNSESDQTAINDFTEANFYIMFDAIFAAMRGLTLPSGFDVNRDVPKNFEALSIDIINNSNDGREIILDDVAMNKLLSRYA